MYGSRSFEGQCQGQMSLNTFCPMEHVPYVNFNTTQYLSLGVQGENGHTGVYSNAKSHTKMHLL